LTWEYAPDFAGFNPCWADIGQRSSLRAILQPSATCAMDGLDLAQNVPQRAAQGPVYGGLPIPSRSARKEGDVTPVRLTAVV
jgi:hypothetical protein